MTKVNKATQIKAIERIFAFRKNGATLHDARVIVANEFNTSVWKLTQWQKEHGPKTATFNSKTVETSDLLVSRRGTSTLGLNNLYNNLSTVVTRLCDPNDDISYKEAGAISSVASNMIGIAKLNLEVHKYAVKTANKSMTVDKLLNQ